jgi:hypothetical protein
MDSFYTGLRDGLTRDAALQRAQVAYLDTHEGLAASPFYWAAPILSGETSPLPLQGPNPLRSPLAMVLFAMLGVAVLAGVAWRRRTQYLNA